MKWSLLLVFIVTSCLPSDKIDNSAAKGNASAGSRGESFHHQYRFGNFGNSVDFAIKIDRARDGEFIDLQTINLSTDTAINQIPLQQPRFTTGAGKSYYYGDSYRSTGGEWSVYAELSTDRTSIADLDRNPPQISFDSFLKNSGIVDGKAVRKLTASEWQQLAGQRPKAPSFADPSPLPSNSQQWFNNHFNSGFKKLEKLEHNRAVTIDGNLHYGAIYQGYDGANRCWVQLWGFDDVEVVNFFRSLNLGLKRNLTEESPTISCKNSYELTFDCERDSVKEQGVLKIVNNNLIVRQTKGKISVHIDSNGDCHEGAPTP